MVTNAIKIAQQILQKKITFGHNNNNNNNNISLLQTHGPYT